MKFGIVEDEGYIYKKKNMYIFKMTPFAPTHS